MSKLLKPWASELMEWALLSLFPRKFLMRQGALGLRCAAKFYFLISWIICGRPFNPASSCDPLRFSIVSPCPRLCVLEIMQFIRPSS